MDAVALEFLQRIVDAVKDHERKILVASHDPWDESVVAIRSGVALSNLAFEIVHLLDYGPALPTRTES